MANQDKYGKLRKERIEKMGFAVPTELQGVTKDRFVAVLSRLDLRHRDIIDCVFALLDDQTESFKNAMFSEGATTAQLGCHISFLQRDNVLKLDREGRDSWIKPLREIGAIEAVTLHEGIFIAGHVIAKSPNSSYRLDQTFITILKSPEDSWHGMLTDWISEDSTRRRLEMQAQAIEESRKSIDTGHKKLIQVAISVYVPRFLPGFEILYVDDSDGDRISPGERNALERAGVSLELRDAFPDILLWNPSSDVLWCIEAVTSDGEVDSHKVNQMRRLAQRHGKTDVGFTTVYQSWKSAALRQDANRNLAIGSYLWIASDPSRHLEVKSFEVEQRLPSSNHK